MEKDFAIDTLTEVIGVLTRREAEARILIPLIDALGNRFGQNEVVAVVSEAIIRVAKDQGRELAETMGGSSAAHFMDSLSFWTKDNALEIKINKQTDKVLSFDVTRCRYAEMYQALGAFDLGHVFSCNRDFALIDGFNPKAVLVRNHTILQGDPVCDFRYDFSADVDQ